MGKHITAKEFYSGFDPETGRDFTLQVGESIEVSDEKYEQLDRDGLLGRFEVGRAAAKATSNGSEELGRLKVPELQAKATELGIETKGADGKDLKKADLVKALEAKQQESADELDELDRELLIHVAGETGIADPADLDDVELRRAIRSARGGNG